MDSKTYQHEADFDAKGVKIYEKLVQKLEMQWHLAPTPGTKALIEEQYDEAVGNLVDLRRSLGNKLEMAHLYARIEALEAGKTRYIKYFPE